MTRRTPQAQQRLVFRIGDSTCAFPLEHVGETMRPLPIEPVADCPAFMLGLSIVRGLASPVVHLAQLLGLGKSSPIERFVTIRSGGRQVVLAVGEVRDVRAFPSEGLSSCPPLLGNARSELIEAVGVNDAGLLFVLQGGRMVPDAAWAALDAREVRS